MMESTIIPSAVRSVLYRAFLVEHTALNVFDQLHIDYGYYILFKRLFNNSCNV